MATNVGGTIEVCGEGVSGGKDISTGAGILISRRWCSWGRKGVEGEEGDGANTKIGGTTKIGTTFNKGSSTKIGTIVKTD